MADSTKRKKEEAIKWKVQLMPHQDVINRLQAMLLWLDTSGKVQFVILCVAVHLGLSVLFSICGKLTVPALFFYGMGIFVLGKYLASKSQIPWHTLLSFGSSSGSAAQGPVKPYTIDELVQFIQSICQFFTTVQIEMERLKNIHYAKYTAQVTALLLLLGFLTNYISLFSLSYIIAYTLLLLPGVYAHGLFGKLVQAISSQPHCARAIAFVKGHYTKMVGSIHPQPAAAAAAPVSAEEEEKEEKPGEPSVSSSAAAAETTDKKND